MGRDVGDGRPTTALDTAERRAAVRLILDDSLPTAAIGLALCARLKHEGHAELAGMVARLLGVVVPIEMPERVAPSRAPLVGALDWSRRELCATWLDSLEDEISKLSAVAEDQTRPRGERRALGRARARQVQEEATALLEELNAFARRGLTRERRS